MSPWWQLVSDLKNACGLIFSIILYGKLSQMQNKLQISYFLQGDRSCSKIGKKTTFQHSIKWNLWGFWITSHCCVIGRSDRNSLAHIEPTTWGANVQGDRTLENLETLEYLQCYSQSRWLLSYWPFSKKLTLETVPPLMALGMEQWNNGIVHVKSWNGWELWGQQLCE